MKRSGGSIYKLAAEVDVYIGEASDDSDLTMDFLSDFETKYDVREWNNLDARSKFEIGHEQTVALNSLSGGHGSRASGFCRK